MRVFSIHFAQRPACDDVGPRKSSTGHSTLSLFNCRLAGLLLVSAIALAWCSRLGLTCGPDVGSETRTASDASTIAYTFSPDRQTIATTDTSQRAALWRSVDGGCVRRFLETRGHAWAVAFSPDGLSLALGGVEPDIILCDLKPGGAERPLGLPIDRTTAVVFAPDGQSVAATSDCRNEIMLWDLETARMRRPYVATRRLQSASPWLPMVGRWPPGSEQPPRSSYGISTQASLAGDWRLRVPRSLRLPIRRTAPAWLPRAGAIALSSFGTLSRDSWSV